MGKIKKRIYPRDITINIGKGAPVPKHPYPGEWRLCHGSFSHVATAAELAASSGRRCSLVHTLALYTWPCALQPELTALRLLLCCPAGQQWKEVRHDNTVTWLAFWRDPVNTKEYKWVQFHCGSDRFLVDFFDEWQGRCDHVNTKEYK